MAKSYFYTYSISTKNHSKFIKLGLEMKKFLLILFVITGHISIYSKKVVSQSFRMEFLKDKHWLNQRNWFKVVPLQEILQNNPQIIYKKIIDKVYFNYPEFSLSSKFPHEGYFDELFILSIPNGRVQGMCGHVFIDKKLSDEMARGDRFECLVDIPRVSEQAIKKISGRVAVIAQHGAGGKWANYYHAIYEAFGRLAMLEISGIEYDWLYIPLDKKYVREALRLWGVNFEKIIAPSDENFIIEADELIVPSMVINTSCGHAHAGNFQHPITLNYIREKLLVGAKKEKVDTLSFSKKIFISRKDSYNARRILNEDEVFNLFKAKDFERYEMSKLSVAEQVLLLDQAEIVVSEQGSGLANILFCKPNTVIVEIFQALIDNCFWWVSHVLGLQYVPIKTLLVDTDYYANWRLRSMEYYFKNNILQTYVPLDEIQKFVKTL